MAYFRKALGLKYAVLALAITIFGLLLRQPLVSGDTAGRILIRVTITVAMFAVISLADAIWPPPGRKRRTAGWYAKFLLCLAVGLLAVNLFSNQILSWLDRYVSVGAIVEAGGGWLLPGLIVGVFFLFFFWLRHVKGRRSP